MVKALRPFACAAVLLGLALIDAHGQDTVVATSGTRIRILSARDTTWRVGRIATITADSLAIRQCDQCGDTVFARHQVLEIDVWRRDPRIGRRNERIGMAAAFVLMAGYGVVGIQQCERESRERSEGPPCAIGYGLVIPMAGAAAFAGGLIGAMLPASRWYRATLDR